MDSQRLYSTFYQKHGCVRSYHLKPTYNLLLKFEHTVLYLRVERNTKVAFDSPTLTHTD
jgi:hypothetical protein